MLIVAMASVTDSWMREFNEASKLADEISEKISGSDSLLASGQTQRQLSTWRRKVTILRTKLETLQLLLPKLPSERPITSKELNRREGILRNLSTKANQMANTLNMTGLGNRDSLFDVDKKADDAMSRTVGLDNHGLVDLQHKIMKEQDESLEKLEVTVISTKHIALAVNEELNLHTKLLDDLDQHVDLSNSYLMRVKKQLAVLNRGAKRGCSRVIMLIIAIASLIVVFALIKYFVVTFALIKYL